VRALGTRSAHLQDTSAMGHHHCIKKPSQLLNDELRLSLNISSERTYINCNPLEFPKFEKLPAGLRLMIWNCASYAFRDITVWGEVKISKDCG
jgi:hypothetical protein